MTAGPGIDCPECVGEGLINICWGLIDGGHEAMGGDSCPACHGSGRIDCEHCGKPENELGSRLCEQCHEELERAASRQRSRDAYEGWCDFREKEMREEGR